METMLEETVQALEKVVAEKVRGRAIGSAARDLGTVFPRGLCIAATCVRCW